MLNMPSLGSDENPAHAFRARSRLITIVQKSDLTSISEAQFRKLCKLFANFPTTIVCEGRPAIKMIINDEMHRLDFEFVDVDPAKMSKEQDKRMQDILAQRKFLRELIRVLGALHDTARTALLIRIEQVIENQKSHLEHCFAEVYAEMRSPRTAPDLLVLSDDDDEFLE